MLAQGVGTLVLLPVVVLLLGSEWPFDQRSLIFVSWGGALSLALARRQPATARLADRLWNGWRRADALVAIALIYLVLFRVPAPIAASCIGATVVVGVVVLAKRVPLAVVLSACASALLLVLVVPRALTAVVISNLSKTHELTIDHRLLPDGRDINVDGIRHRGVAEDIAEDDFVVLFLGDSFTFGVILPYEAAYPAVVERILARGSCDQRVRTVNFGWTSSSPLLSLRLLREIGFKYRPDLVVYNLDATDFHDDIRYEIDLRKVGDFELDRGALIARLAARYAPWLRLDWRSSDVLRDLLREPRGTAGVGFGEDTTFPGPTDRFYATAHPLEKTRSAIERSTMKHLEQLYEFSSTVLSSDLVVVLYPRAYQYSRREIPRNWEASEYEVLGPYVKEPFRYFRQVESTLPYPVVSLLSDFETTTEFPLYFEDDPHWNARGAWLAARGVARALVNAKLVPCENRGKAKTSASLADFDFDSDSARAREKLDTR